MQALTTAQKRLQALSDLLSQLVHIGDELPSYGDMPAVCSAVLGVDEAINVCDDGLQVDLMIKLSIEESLIPSGGIARGQRRQQQ